MHGHWKSMGIGTVVAMVGLVLWLTTGEVDTLVVSLSKIGVVLMVVGAIEVVISVVALAVPSTRHRSGRL